ncbi:MAG TPA: mycofactocin precursor MftA [Acidimicrobiales bacterium]|jgi:mycofactocin precursor|nr:mycofactocin precursor MftA [Acidimicrobiales bacterium]
MTVTTTEHEATARDDQTHDPAPAGAAAIHDDGLVEEDLLVEDVSIDGMCGVY